MDIDLLWFIGTVVVAAIAIPIAFREIDRQNFDRDLHKLLDNPPKQD